MTAVVCVLNKSGVAIAADSAVTIGPKEDCKVENSANKMFRLSSTQPVSIMITGNANFLMTPWDIIIRLYRQKNQDKSLETVRDYVNDFFSFTENLDAVFVQDSEYFVNVAFFSILQELQDVAPQAKFSISGECKNVDELANSYLKNIAKLKKHYKSKDILEAFVDYTFDSFKKDSLSSIDKCLNSINEKDPLDYDILKGGVLETFLELVYLEIVHWSNIFKRNVGELVFSGYGAKEQYPSVISVMVAGGLYNKIRRVIRTEVHISNEVSSAICPFAQDDTVLSLLMDVTPSYLDIVKNCMENMYCGLAKNIAQYSHLNVAEACELSNIMKENIEINGYFSKFKDFCNEISSQSMSAWLKNLTSYSVRDMADLANILIEMAGFEKHLMHNERSVGGPVDLAVMTRNYGFTWLQRKSWYHHKDVNGSYGPLGV